MLEKLSLKKKKKKKRAKIKKKDKPIKDEKEDPFVKDKLELITLIIKIIIQQQNMLNIKQVQKK